MLRLGAGDLQAAARPADLDHCPAGHLIGELQAGAVMRQRSAGDKDAEAHVLILAAAARPGASRIIGLAETAENSDVEPRPVAGDAQHHRLLVPGTVDLDAVAGELGRASCGERCGRYVSIAVGAGSLK